MINSTVSSSETISVIGETTDYMMNIVMSFVAGLMPEKSGQNVTSIHELPGCKKALGDFVDNSMVEWSLIVVCIILVQVSNL